MMIKDVGICIRTVDYSETSQILTFFTRLSGKVDVIAKGSKRPKSPFEGPIELLARGRMVFTSVEEHKLATLTEFQHQNVFTTITRNMFALNSSLFTAELTNKLTHEYDSHPRLFDDFLQFLQNTEQTTDKHDLLTLLILFQLSLLKEIGLQPILASCTNCKNDFTQDWHAKYFSSSVNGLLCRDCESGFSEKTQLTTSAAGCLSHLKTIAQADEQTLNEIERILIYHFTELLHRHPRMAKYILKT